MSAAPQENKPGSEFDFSQLATSGSSLQAGGGAAPRSNRQPSFAEIFIALVFFATVFGGLMAFVYFKDSWKRRQQREAIEIQKEVREYRGATWSK
ncbi:MAG: hypothetical protein ACKVP0_07660 [Pirellulaceae bacterium]